MFWACNKCNGVGGITVWLGYNRNDIDTGYVLYKIKYRRGTDTIKLDMCVGGILKSCH